MFVLFSIKNMGKGEKYMSKMLINLEGEEWKRVRNTLTPAFSASKLKVVRLYKPCPHLSI